MAPKPIWMVFLLASVVTTWIAVTLLCRLNEGERIAVVGSPSVVPGTFLGVLCACVACGWLVASYASESELGVDGYLVGTLGLAVPWDVVVRHNRALP